MTSEDLCAACRDEGVCSHYFGVCPECGKSDGYINVSRTHWFFCKAHKTKWCIGANLFSSWREQTEDEQRRDYDEIGMGEFTSVKPRHVCTARAEPDEDRVIAHVGHVDPNDFPF